MQFTCNISNPLIRNVSHVMEGIWKFTLLIKEFILKKELFKLLAIEFKFDFIFILDCHKIWKIKLLIGNLYF